jgi:hypothetical protein
MPIHFTIDAQGRLVRAAATGDATECDTEFRQFLDALTAHPDFRPGFDVLYDRRGVSRTPDDDLVRAATGAIVERIDRLAGCRWAVVVGAQPGLEVVRLTALLGERAGVEARPFFDPDDALTWFGRAG